MSEHDKNNTTSKQESSATNATTAEDATTIKNNKQQRKMARILAKAWNLENAHIFQQTSSSESNEDVVFDLTSIGQRLDTGCYSDLELGWRQFCTELGYVYNRIITR